MRPLRIKTISEFHRSRNLPKPEHPLISVIAFDKLKDSLEKNGVNEIFDFYSVSIKNGVNGKMKYGQQEYDFDEGIMYFIAPNQTFKIEIETEAIQTTTGWVLLVHPDFFLNTPLAEAIKKYEYFGYAINEALFLSEREETIVNGIVQNIKQEYHSNIDRFSQSIIISQLETLFNYSERFYQRQFITRKITNHSILVRLEKLLAKIFDSHDLVSKGIPTVQYIAESLNISPSYLSSLLKVLTGQSTQQHIHDKLIEKAKEKLSTTDLSISEIAYELGFEHPPSFSKFFKFKTNESPLQFRNSLK
jgi:AraC-like DNA-binding protein